MQKGTKLNEMHMQDQLGDQLCKHYSLISGDTQNYVVSTAIPSPSSYIDIKDFILNLGIMS